MIDDTESFDPRSWVSKKAPAIDDAAASVAVEPPADKPTLSRSVMIVSAIALMTAATGGFLLWHRSAPASAAAGAVATPKAGTPATSIGQSSRTLVIAKPAALSAALISAGLSEADARAAAAAAGPAINRRSDPLRVAMTLERQGTADRLVRMEVAFDDSAGAIITRGPDNGFVASIQVASLNNQVCTASGEMDGQNFYSSAVAAGVPDTLIAEIAKALSFDFDFQREVDKGDTFEVSYRQAFNRAGKAVGIPALEFVRLTTASKSATLYAFATAGGQPGWFDGNGMTTVRTLMRTPIDGARVSSNFGMRMHPILHFEKMHKGVDFAAPIGTPIFASGDAEVIGAVLTATEGRMVKLRHPNGWVTLYMHMSRIMDGIVVGVKVAQGQQIGEVGNTGRSTGPHLHYQVEIDGVPVDPLSLPMGETKPPLSGPERAAFMKQRDKVDASRRGSTRC